MSPQLSTALVDGRHVPRTIDTCYCTWHFDETNRRFRRVLRHALVSGVSTEWRAYKRLVLDPSGESFVVILEPQGARVLVGRRCGSGCRCGAADEGGRSQRAPAAPRASRVAKGWAPSALVNGAAAARIIPLPPPVFHGADAG